MLSIAGQRAGAHGCSLATLEPPVDGKHRLTPEAPRLNRESPGPFEADASHCGWSAAHPTGKEIEGAADADP